MIALTLALTGCKDKWKYKWDMFIGDSEREALIGTEGRVVYCSDPEFERYTCLREDKLAELETEIKRTCKKKSFFSR